MKKLVALAAVVFAAAACMTACAVSISDMGKIEIVSTPEPAETAAGTAVEEGMEAASPAEEPAAEEAASPSLDQQQMQELVEEGIVPEAAVKQEDGDAVYDEQEVGRALQEYADRISCSPTMISGNNMIIEVRNGNDVTIPMVTVHVNYPDGEKTYNFYQFAPGGTIIVPVEKDDGDLPPAVTASVSVTMNANSRTDISDSLAVEESMTDTSYTLTITNHSSFACQNISVTALFSDDSGIICAQTASSDETVLSGKSTQLTFTLPEKLTEKGVTFTKASYCINEAVG